MARSNIAVAVADRKIRERPILFSAPMIRAILAGQKTQTRRVLSQQLSSQPFMNTFDSCRWHYRDGYEGPGPSVWDLSVLCPYGKRGERLWVRETWRAIAIEDGRNGVEFAADKHFLGIDDTSAAASRWVDAYANGKHGDSWRPSIFMPRWASRITLEVAAVRTERVQEISSADVAAEGVDSHFGTMTVNGERATGLITAQYAFACLWNSVNDKRPGCSWQDNPWCWVISFRVVK